MLGHDRLARTEIYLDFTESHVTGWHNHHLVWRTHGGSDRAENQVQSEDDMGKALKQVKDAGWIPEETVRLCVVGDGADWICKHVQALFPDASQVLDSYPCSEYLHQVAYAPYGPTLQALEWVEATLTRLYLGHVAAVLGGLPKRLKTAESLSASLALARSTASYVAAAIRWAVGGSNRRINSSVMSA